MQATINANTFAVTGVAEEKGTQKANLDLYFLKLFRIN